MRRVGIGAVSVIAWRASACSVLEPQPDVSRYFVLTPVAETTAVGAGPATDGARQTLAVGPVIMPAYLDRLEIVRRSGQNQLVLSSTGVWGEPLDRNLQGVVCVNLVRLLGDVEVVPYPSFTATGIDQQVSIAILRFDADEHDKVSLDARWTVQRPADKRPTDSRESHIVQQAADGSTESMVAAMSKAVGALSQEIAGNLH